VNRSGWNGRKEKLAESIAASRFPGASLPLYNSPESLELCSFIGIGATRLDTQTNQQHTEKREEQPLDFSKENYCAAKNLYINSEDKRKVASKVFDTLVNS